MCRGDAGIGSWLSVLKIAEGYWLGQGYGAAPLCGRSPLISGGLFTLMATIVLECGAIHA